jgi:hypothetical protein
MDQTERDYDTISPDAHLTGNGTIATNPYRAVSGGMELALRDLQESAAALIEAVDSALGPELSDPEPPSDDGPSDGATSAVTRQVEGWCAAVRTVTAMLHQTRRRVDL